MVLVNLLERTELFGVSQDIREQLVLALADLVTLVARVATHFHNAISGMTSASISVDIYATFPGEIQAFRERCEKIAESMWRRHQLARENLDGDRGMNNLRHLITKLLTFGLVSEVKSIRLWLVPEDRVLTNVAETTSHLAQDREELTCLWMAPYLTRFLKSPLKTLSIIGKPASGKTVTASVVVDHLQNPIGGVSYQTIFIPISKCLPSDLNV